MMIRLNEIFSWSDVHSVQWTVSGDTERRTLHCDQDNCVDTAAAASLPTPTFPLLASVMIFRKFFFQLFLVVVLSRWIMAGV